MLYTLFILLLLLLLVTLIQFNILAFPVKGLPVLMYHKVSENDTDALTVTTARLEEQLRYLKEQHYQPVTLEELVQYLEEKTALPPKPVLITFDDGYTSNYTLAYPLLQRYRMRASIFLPTAYLGKSSSWDERAAPVMSVAELRSMDSRYIEFALHTHRHVNFKHATPETVKEELALNMATLRAAQIPFVPVLAYPYGGRPKDSIRRTAMRREMEAAGIKAAFRIGNRVNRLPFRDRYELKRIDIRGTDSFNAFRTKLKKGRLQQW